MVDDITRKRWQSINNSEKHKPIDAARIFIADIESGRIDPRHVIIAYNGTVEGIENTSGYYQAGSFSQLEQLGLNEMTAIALREIP